MLPLGDTDPRVMRLLLERLRVLSPAERLAMADAASGDLRTLVLAGIRRDRPDADEAEVRRMFALRTLPRDLYEAVFGPGATP
jgi:hypothetical protein